MYENLLRPILFKLPPEKAQSFADFFLKRQLIWEVYHSFLKTSDPRLQISYTNNQNLPSPLGFAAGYDKDCEFLTSNSFRRNSGTIPSKLHLCCPVSFC